MTHLKSRWQGLAYPVKMQKQPPHSSEWETVLVANTPEDIEFRLAHYDLGESFGRIRIITDDGKVIVEATEAEAHQIHDETAQETLNSIRPLHVFANFAPDKAIDTATELLQAAEQSQHFTIEPRSVVPIGHDNLHSIDVCEFDDSVVCRIHTAEQNSDKDVMPTVTFWKTIPDIVKERKEQGLPDDEAPFFFSPASSVIPNFSGSDESVRAFLILLCSSIIRDFWVLEDRSKHRLYLKRTHKERKRTGKGKERKLETIKSYTFIPRFQYDLSVYQNKSDSKVKHSVRVQLAPAHVSGHIRNLPEGWQASDEAKEHAKEFGITLYDGTTFVRPHERGQIEMLRTFRSRSAFEMVFTE